MAQYTYPTADIVDGNWTNEAGNQTNLYESVNEPTTPNDLDYIVSSPTPVADTVRLALSGFTNPDVGTVTLRIRGRRHPVWVNPTVVMFNASPDHDTLVTSYEARYYVVVGNVGPYGTQDLGKPTPVNGVCTANLNLSGFPSSNTTQYVAYIVAIGPGGTSSESGVSNPFMVI